MRTKAKISGAFPREKYGMQVRNRRKVCKQHTSRANSSTFPTSFLFSLFPLILQVFSKMSGFENDISIGATMTQSQTSQGFSLQMFGYVFNIECFERLCR